MGLALPLDTSSCARQLDPTEGAYISSDTEKKERFGRNDENNDKQNNACLQADSLETCCQSPVQRYISTEEVLFLCNVLPPHILAIIEQGGGLE